jgi:hypothetical protein
MPDLYPIEYTVEEDARKFVTEHLWERRGLLCRVQVSCAENFGMPIRPSHMWRLYGGVTAEHPLHRLLLEDTSELSEYPELRSSPEQVLLGAHMHGGVTYSSTDDEGYLVIGCDFGHYDDQDTYMEIPPQDLSCSVHLMAESLFSVLLELGGSDPLILREDFPRMVTLLPKGKLRDIYLEMLQE